MAALEGSRRQLAANGVCQPDPWTALMTGPVDQQVSNDPGGRRWSRLVEEAIDMFLAHCRDTPRTSQRQGGRS